MVMGGVRCGWCSTKPIWSIRTTSSVCTGHSCGVSVRPTWACLVALLNCSHCLLLPPRRARIDNELHPFRSPAMCCKGSSSTSSSPPPPSVCGGGCTGKVLKTPEVVRVYFGSFWEHAHEGSKPLDLMFQKDMVGDRGIFTQHK